MRRQKVIPESEIFAAGELLELREDCDLLEPFIGLLVRNVCADGESVLCEMLVTTHTGRSWLGRVWQGYMRRV